jgi:ribosomal protein S18 acetylase RimI-like enzyme
MKATIEYLLNKTTAAQIAEHLWRCDTDFVPPLSGRVGINNYAMKIASKATRFEAWSGGKLIGLVAAYCNDQANCVAYITSVSVLNQWTGKGIAVHLMSHCIEHAKASGMRQISLQVSEDNAVAIKLYEKSGFVWSTTSAPFVFMSLNLRSGEEHEQQT